MIERPILFSGEMVRAILDGRKTQTRRVGSQWEKGDRLWVRETFALESNFNIEHESAYPPPFDDGRPIQRKYTEGCGEYWQQCHYRATDPAPELTCEKPNCRQCDGSGGGPHWKPSIHMPRWASRITLDVTEVRKQMLKDITHTEVIAEGIAFDGDQYSLHHHWIELWESIYGQKQGYAWADNPEVTVITFEVADG